MKRFLGVAAITLTLTACGMFGGDHGAFRDRTTEYKQAQSVPPLKMPPNVTTVSMSEYYPIPQQEKASKSGAVDLYPPRITILDTSPPPAS